MKSIKKNHIKTRILRDYRIVQNQHDFKLKKGEELPNDFPEHLIAALITEKIIKED